MNIRESKCLDATIRLLEQHLMSVRSQFVSPELDINVPPSMRIDGLVHIGERKFALEHTLVEPFEGFTSSGVITRKAETELRKLLHRLNLSVGIDVLLPASWGEIIPKGAARHRLLEDISNRIRARQAEIESMSDDDRTMVLGEVRGVPVRVARNPFVPAEDGDKSTCIVLVANNNQKQRFSRIERSLCTKVPKLEKWERDCETVLILENTDIALTNVHSISDVLKDRWQTEESIPCDFVIFVNASHSTWRIHTIVFERRWRYIDENGLAKSVRFSESELSPSLI